MIELIIHLVIAILVVYLAKKYMPAYKADTMYLAYIAGILIGILLGAGQV